MWMSGESLEGGGRVRVHSEDLSGVWTSQQELKKEDYVALKTGTTNEEEKSSTDLDEDKDMALIKRKLYSFYKRKYKNNQWKKGGSSSKVTCYVCNKPGHIKAECPQLKGGKRKGLLSTWSDDEFPEDDEEVKDSPRKETSNLCLMAKESEDEQQIEVTETNLPFDELLETYNNLLKDSRKVLEKYGELKISHSKVLKAFGAVKLEKEALEEKIKLMEEEFAMSALITENRKLKATIDKLNYDLEQFVKGEEILNLILDDEFLENIMIQAPAQTEQEQSTQNLQESEAQEVESSVQPSKESSEV
ncbi:Retrovirus-related Pol polyprotein from transposon TNT 1-94 [Senna tora]|uniref:Retrovirus-related Pol polyprotein from transposon TNT 1-94 n=1 Tax=Senna tora TaxID=362788 RepID=A0A834SX74_9FABA|nr:Retrovirus-related Pol polyprotein from transposon TNT 1-94 [Senna tora]